MAPPTSEPPIRNSADIWAAWMDTGEYDLADALRAARGFSYGQLDRALARLDAWKDALHAD